MGWRRHQSGDIATAESIYRQVLQQAPNDANAWCFLGIACHDQSRYDEAMHAYETAIRIQPNFPVALNNSANTLKQMGRFDEAIACCQEALRCKPDYHTAYNNLGVTLVAMGRLEEASRTFEKALQLMPNDVVARTNLGAALVRQGRYDEGTDRSREALGINPNYAEAHKNQAIVWLLLGDFERGWPEYEWRWKCPGSPLPPYAHPLWDGSSLQGRTILLFSEQGLGDTIQFVRYAEVLRQRGARTAVACPKPLLQLLKSCPGIDQLLEQNSEMTSYDVAAPLLSIPGLLQTRRETIPASVPYLSADARLVRSWRDRLQTIPGFRIGVAWQGSTKYHADRERSFPLCELAPLAAVPGVRLISLQKGFGAEQIGSIRNEFEVIDLGDDLDTSSGPFMDTAAIIANLDLIITADTSIGHLAGAMAKPVWLALSLSPDWRWLLNCDDSPWYPTVRLFRQKSLGKWSDVFQQMAEELQGRTERIAPAPSESASARDRSIAFNRLTAEISAGELLDKIAILEIKRRRIPDAAKQQNVRRELGILSAVRDRELPSTPALDAHFAELIRVNEILWNTEDEIRDCERRKDFGSRFVELARTVYRTNDQRSAIKRAVNELTGSRLVEEKSYPAYDAS
jgi:Flp pilus assembly protein TadD